MLKSVTGFQEEFEPDDTQGPTSNVQSRSTLINIRLKIWNFFLRTIRTDYPCALVEVMLSKHMHQVIKWKRFCTEISHCNKLKWLPNLLNTIGTVPTQLTNKRIDQKETEVWRIKTSKNVTLSGEVSIIQPAYLQTVKASIFAVSFTHFTYKGANLPRNRHTIAHMILSVNAENTLLMFRFPKLYSLLFTK